jgi:hypothetical protein
MASFIEAYLHKAELHAITFEDFNNFYKLKLDESQTLEYKSGELLVGYQGKYVRDGILDKEEANKGFIKLATSIAGFANAIGGLFILGVKEIQVKKGGQTVRKRPGAIFPVPDNIISKEMIGSKLRELIRLSIDDLIILPLRTTKTGNHSIYLIDVPQSFRVPHRVNELDYPQRNNFETIPMLHHQISDLFGKRLAPDLDLIFQKEASDEGLLKVRILIRNQGRAVAKYVTGVCSVVSGSYEVIQTDWQNRGENSWQFATGFYSVVYPEVHFDTGTFSFKLIENATEKSLSLRFGLYAEGMTGKSFLIPLVPNHFP